MAAPTEALPISLPTIPAPPAAMPLDGRAAAAVLILLAMERMLMLWIISVPMLVDETLAVDIAETAEVAEREAADEATTVVPELLTAQT